MKYIVLLLLSLLLLSANGQSDDRVKLRDLQASPNPANTYILRSLLDTSEWQLKSDFLSGIPSGSGTSGTLTKWTGTTTIGDAAITEDATRLSASLPFRLANIPTVSLPGVPLSGDLLYNTTAGNLSFYGSSAWEYSVKSSTSNGLFTANSVLFADANGRVSQDNAGLFFNSSSNALGINTATPRSGFKVDVFNGNFISSSSYIQRSTYPYIYIIYNGTYTSSSDIDWSLGMPVNEPVLHYGARPGSDMVNYNRNPVTTDFSFVIAGRPASNTNSSNSSPYFEVMSTADRASSSPDTSYMEGIAIRAVRTSRTLGDYSTKFYNRTTNTSGVGVYTEFMDVTSTGVVSFTNPPTGISSTNWFTSDNTYTGNRAHDAATYTTTITNNGGWTLSGTGTNTFESTTGTGGQTTFSTNDGLNNQKGDLIHNLQFNAIRSGSSSAIARIQAYYNGDSTTRNGRLDFLVATAAAAGVANMQLISLESTGEKYFIAGDFLSTYLEADFDAVNMFAAGNVGTATLGVDNSDKESIALFQDDKTVVFGGYGNNTKTADDLSKTRSGLVLAPATDGTMYEAGGILFTQTADGTVANTVTETTIVATGKGSATIPADYLEEVGRTVIIKATGYFTTDDAHTLQMRVDLGGVTVGDASGITLPDLATGNEHWELEFVFTIRTTGVSGTAIGQGKFRFCEAIGGSTNPCVESEMLNTSTFTVDTTIANALDVTAQWGTASSTSSITCTNLVVKAEN